MNPSRTSLSLLTVSRPHAAGLSAALAAWLLLLSPRPARAEDVISYKYQDYREADGRIVVKTQAALIDKALGTDLHLKLQGVVDTIAGATPNGQPAPAGSDQVVLADLDERRKAWSADLSRQFARFNLALGVANSRESDYVSNGWSINTLSDFNQKNTTLRAGIGGTNDDVKVFYQTGSATKRTQDVVVGVTQLLDPRTSVTFNLSWGHATGYLNDQYKLVQKKIEVAPGIFLPLTFGENRPDKRTKWIALAALNRDLPRLHAALDASYRLYHDSFGTDAHTLDVSWFQHAGSQLLFVPHFRYYSQTAADFYYYDLDRTPIVPVSGTPRPEGPFFSSDYRLSELRSYTYGLKLVWTASSRWQFDASIERYDMHGGDGQTPQSAYPRANVVTVGGQFSW